MLSCDVVQIWNERNCDKEYVKVGNYFYIRFSFLIQQNIFQSDCFIPQCEALWFTDGEICWVYWCVGDFLQTISHDCEGSRMSDFDIKVASIMRMMCTLGFLEKVFNCDKICKKTPR